MVFEEKSHEAFQAIANHLGCSEIDVEEAFHSNPDPMSATPEAQQGQRSAKQELDRLQSSLKKSAEILAALPPLYRRQLVSIGAVTGSQLEQSADKVGGLAESSLLLDGRGGKNWAATIVAYNLVELFENIGKEVTFGHINGEPNTEYGRAVAFALGAFEIGTDWRAVAREAFRNTRT